MIEELLLIVESGRGGKLYSDFASYYFQIHYFVCSDYSDSADYWCYIGELDSDYSRIDYYSGCYFVNCSVGERLNIS
jgi:hypothetical protein